MKKFSDINLLAFGHTIQMAGAVYAGEGGIYLCLFPDEQLDSAIVPLEMSQDDWKQLLRQTDLLETEVLAQATDGSLVKAIIRKGQRQIEQGTSWLVFRRDGVACRYCGADDVPLTVDHLVCWEDGGPSEPENLLSCCRKCNKVRGNLAYEAWLKHPYYLDVSRRLSDATRRANEELALTLDAIPRRRHVRSR